jgi:nucleotide-binding universal stress UspA family protein
MDGRTTTVVGVDGSDTSVAALRWACGEASLTGARIEVLIAWQWPFGFGAAVPIVSGYDPAGDARMLLEAIASGMADEFPSVEIAVRAVEGHPGEVLVEASRHADLLVVGCRGHGEITGMLLGSVSQHCAAHAASPVLIFRPAAP